MFSFLIPDYHFKSVQHIPENFFSQNGIKGILFDVDNTLEPYSTALPSLKTISLFSELKASGIKISIISNNKKDRIEKFCKTLDVPFYYESAKPSSKNVLTAINEMGLSADAVAIVGDQLFTDIWCAHNSKIKGILVDRINNSESFFIKMKRALEKPFMAYINKKGYGKIK